MVAVLALLAGWQPKWLPSWLRGPLIGVIAATGLVAGLVQILAPEGEVPVLALFIFAAVVGLITLACILMPRALGLFVDRSSQLREAVRACFDVLLYHQELDLTDLRARAEAVGGTTFADRVWKRAVEILEQEGALRKKQNERQS